MVFFWGYLSLTFQGQTIQMNFNRSILQKEILALLQRYLKERRLNLKTEAGFAFGNESIAFLILF
jgi:hypothetical protein